jgi:hypothetical protein
MKWGEAGGGHDQGEGLVGWRGGGGGESREDPGPARTDRGPLSP